MLVFPDVYLPSRALHEVGLRVKKLPKLAMEALRCILLAECMDPLP